MMLDVEVLVKSEDFFFLNDSLFLVIMVEGIP